MTDTESARTISCPACKSILLEWEGTGRPQVRCALTYHIDLNRDPACYHRQYARMQVECSRCGLESEHSYPPEPTPSEPEKPEEYAEAVLGVREWKVGPDGLLCALVHGDSSWGPGEDQHATCQRHHDTLIFRYGPGGPSTYGQEPARPPSHAAPKRGCQCGLHAWYGRDLAEKHGDGSLGATRVRGLVAAWGRAVFSEWGFKSEFMRVEAILLEKPTLRVFGSEVSLVEAHERLAERYGVPLLKPDEIEPYAAVEEFRVLEPDPEPKRYDWPRDVQRAVQTSHILGGSIGVHLDHLYGPPPVLPGSRGLRSGQWTFDLREHDSLAFNRPEQTTYREWREKTRHIREKGGY